MTTSILYTEQMRWQSGIKIQLRWVGAYGGAAVFAESSRFCTLCTL